MQHNARRCHRSKSTSGVVGQFKPLSWDGGVTKSTSLSTVTEFKRINLPPLMLKLDATLNSVLLLPALHELPAQYKSKSVLPPIFSFLPVKNSAWCLDVHENALIADGKGGWCTPTSNLAGLGYIIIARLENYLHISLLLVALFLPLNIDLYSKRMHWLVTRAARCKAPQPPHTLYRRPCDRKNLYLDQLDLGGGVVLVLTRTRPRCKNKTRFPVSVSEYFLDKFSGLWSGGSQWHGRCMSW